MKYGEIISVKEKFRRTWNKDGTGKVWKVTPYVSEECLFLGYRILSNGTNQYNYGEGRYSYKPTEHFRVGLVSPGCMLNPIYVPLDFIEYPKTVR